jgi:hypothetical protein
MRRLAAHERFGRWLVMILESSTHGWISNKELSWWPNPSRAIIAGDVPPDS